MAPGIIAMMKLSVTSITAIERVSAASTTVSAAPRVMPAFKSGRVDRAYPKRKASPMAKIIVIWLGHPRAVPIIKPRTSPMAHPVRQWSVALIAILLRAFSCVLSVDWCMELLYPRGVYFVKQIDEKSRRYDLWTQKLTAGHAGCTTIRSHRGCLQRRRCIAKGLRFRLFRCIQLRLNRQLPPSNRLVCRLVLGVCQC